MVVKDVNLYHIGYQITVTIFAKCRFSDMPSTWGTMIGPDGHIHRWTAPRRKFIQRVLKINVSTKSLVERLRDFINYTVFVLSYIGSICAPDKATLKAEAHALQCTTAESYNAIPTNVLGVGSVCGLGPDLVGIDSINFAARYRTAACSKTLNKGLEKIQAARAFDFALSCTAPTGKKTFLFLPWLIAPRMLSIF